MARRKRTTRGRRKKKRVEKKKVVFLVIDGLADLPVNETTPLREAKKPNLDWLAENGATGQLKLLPKTVYPTSHVANIALLGYNPKKVPLKRGVLEAVGVDLPYKEGHLALRCNFATVDENLKVIDRRAGRNVLGLDSIARYINTHVDIEVPFLLKRTYGHRAVLLVKMNLSDAITSNDPSKIGEKVKRISALNPDALVSAKIVQSFIDKAREVMEFHPANAKRIEKGIPPANYILTRGAGNSLTTLPNFSRRYKLKAVCVAENGVMKATCMLAGFNAVTVPEFTDDGKINFEKTLDFIFDNINDLLPEYDFVYAHMKGPDEAAHDGDFKRKVKAIEAIDKKLDAFRDFDGILVVTCDHITSTEEKRHVYGAVPLLVYGKGKDRVKTFDEFSVKKGKLKSYTGRKLMRFLFGK